MKPLLQYIVVFFRRRGLQPPRVACTRTTGALAPEESLFMSRLIDRSAPGNSYFVTTKCHQRRHDFQMPASGQILVRTLFHRRGQNAHLLHEFVVMPGHLHLIFTPPETTSLEKGAGPGQGGSSHRIHKGREHKMEIWRQGFYDWTICDAND